VTKSPAKPKSNQIKSFGTFETFHLHMLAALSERYSEQYYRKLYDLNLPECRVVGIVGGQGTITFKRVCQYASLEKSYASRVINRLADRGFIAKVDNPQDQRSIILELTATGRKLHDELYRSTQAVNNELLSVLNQEQRREFMGYLLLLADNARDLTERGTVPNENGADEREETAPSPPAFSATPGAVVPLDTIGGAAGHDAGRTALPVTGTGTGPHGGTAGRLMPKAGAQDGTGNGNRGAKWRCDGDG